MKGADVFLGLICKRCVTKDMIKSMAKNPIIFACANPDPEIKPELIDEVEMMLLLQQEDLIIQIKLIILLAFLIFLEVHLMLEQKKLMKK